MLWVQNVHFLKNYMVNRKYYAASFSIFYPEMSNYIKKSKIKICHIISGDLWAGAEMMGWNLLRELKKFSELEIFVVLLNNGRLAQELRACSLDVRVFNETTLCFPRLLHAVCALTREKSPHVIHSHRYKENILAFFNRGARNGGARLVATQHGLPERAQSNSGLTSRLADRLNRYILSRRFDRVVGVSEDIRAKLIRDFGLAAKNIMVIHNGIDLPETIPVRHKNPVSVVGSAGRFFPVKDYPLMVEIAGAVVPKAPLRFELAGEGPEKSRIDEHIAACAVGGVFHFRGHVVDMGGFYKGLDIYLNTSVHEGIPMTILEAMACGLPVVAPKVGGISEIITDDVEGFLIPTRDPRDFAEKCLLLHHDPAMRERMGRAARARVEKDFSASAMAQQYCCLYHELARV